jgi:zinc protease
MEEGRMVKSTRSLPKLDVSSLPGPETIQRTELGNGIVFLARENFASPSVVVSGFQEGGSILEGSDDAGLADLMMSMLMRGTKSRNFQEIYESIESIGASLRLGMGKHSYSFFGKSLAEDLDHLLELLSDVLRNPSFPKEQFNRMKAEKLTSLAIRDQNTGARAHLAFSNRAYPDHPYKTPTSGFQSTIKPIELNQVRKFHRSLIGPEGFVITVVGGIGSEKALASVQRFLGDWNNTVQATAPDLPELTPLEGIVREDIHLEGKIQSDIVMGVHGPSRYEPDYLAGALGNNILGRFGMFGRIGAQVREAAGLAYYAYSSMEGGPGPGAWKAIAGVNPVNIDQAIDLMRDEIRKFITQGVTLEELTDNQANFIGSMPLRLETNEGVAGALMHFERYGLGMDYYQRYPHLISSITRDQVLDIARRFLNSDDLVIAVAGPEKNGS